MQVRKFQAATMQEALKLVRRDLGPQAIIISTKAVGGKHAVGQGSIGEGDVEVLAALDFDFGSSADAGKSTPRAAETKVSQWGELLSDKVSMEHIRHELGELKQMIVQGASYNEKKRNDFICKELEDLKWIAQFLVRQSVPLHTHDFSEQTAFFYLQMLKQGMSEEIALKLIGELKSDLSADALSDRKRVKESLIAKIERALPPAGPGDVSRGKRKIVSLVGPTGVGKTTTIAKLAALYSLDKKMRVALVTIDTFRIAAVEQLKVYAKIMKLPFKAVSSPAEFNRALTQFNDMDLILVDTAGRSQRDLQHIRELKTYLQQPMPVEVSLVMSCTHKEDALSSTGAQFGLLPVDSIIFTKLDESHTFGSMVNQLLTIKKPLLYLTTGQQVPDDIENATKKRIVSLLLGDEEIYNPKLMLRK